MRHAVPLCLARPCLCTSIARGTCALPHGGAVSSTRPPASPRLPAPGEAYTAGSSGSRTNGQQGTPVCAAARGPVCAAADTAPLLDSPRRPLGCQALFWPPWCGHTRSNRCCACALTSAPQGAHKEGTGAAALCPCHGFLSPPFPLYEGALPIAPLLAVGQLVFYWPGCVLRPLQASPPAKPQDACLLLAGRARSTTLAALTQRCQLLRRCASSFQGSAM